ncbi:hypothetical protein D3C80_1979120 [compost metagenome]
MLADCCANKCITTSEIKNTSENTTRLASGVKHTRPNSSLTQYCRVNIVESVSEITAALR